MDAAVRVSHGVWMPAAAAAQQTLRLAALLGALPAGTVLSGRTAAARHGMWLPPSGPEVDVTVPATAAGPELTIGPRRRGVRAHRRDLRADEITVLDGLPVTAPARTWYDLAGELPLGDLVAGGDSALAAGLVDVLDLVAGLARRRGRRGTGRARRALPLLDAASRSRPESHLRVLLVTAGLPRPAVNVPVHDVLGQWLAVPDLSYAGARLAIEYQGSDHADPERMRRDAARDMDLRRAGWEVFYYTSAQVYRHPEIPVADVHRALARRSLQLLDRRLSRSGPTEQL